MLKKQILLFLCLSVCFTPTCAEPRIELPTIQIMKSADIPAVKEIVVGCYYELTTIPTPSVWWVRLFTWLSGTLKDIDNFSQEYLDKGAFLVVRDKGAVVGMGAIRKIDAETAELRRVYFLKEYRGRGLGSAMVRKLMQVAREYGYKKLRLEVGNIQKQQAAISTYKKCGFYEIPSYSSRGAQLAMEAQLK